MISVVTPRYSSIVEFFQDFLGKIWNWLFAMEFDFWGIQVSFGNLFVYSFMFTIGFSIICTLVNSYSRD